VRRSIGLLLMGLWLGSGVGPAAGAEPDEPSAPSPEEEAQLRDQALALFEERCAPFKDTTYPDQAPWDYQQLLDWGYEPAEILMYAEGIPETCLQISFLDAISIVIRTYGDDPLLVPVVEPNPVVSPRGIRPLQGPEVALPVLGVSLIVGGTLAAWFSPDIEGYSPVVFGMMVSGITLSAVSIGMIWSPDRPRPGPGSLAAASREIRWTVGPGSVLVRF